jgi:hypothetical protein
MLLLKDLQEMSMYGRFFLFLPFPEGLRFLLFRVFFAITSAKIRYLRHYLLILRLILVVSVL